MSKDRVDKVTADLLSRRSLLSSRTAYLLSLIAIPQLLYACGSSQSDASPPPSSGSETKQPVAKKSPARNRRKQQSADAEAIDSTQNTASKDAGEDEDELNAQVNDDDVRKETADEILVSDRGDINDSATTTNNRDQAAGVPQSMVRGATPDSGFFSASAPQLTREQILAGQQIRGRCEGGLHELIIEPEHLQALARGEAVTIRSSTHTHIGNPTVHNHSIRYTPQLG